MLRRHALKRILPVIVVGFLTVPLTNAQPNTGVATAATGTTDLTTECTHEDAFNVGSSIEVQDGETVYRNDIRKNQTHRYFHRNFNVTTMTQNAKYRKLIINLEPCFGIVYLFIRKTRRCYPNPYSCIDLGTGERTPKTCEWTHFQSEIEGSRDGTPTFFEIPLSSTKFFISVFAASDSAYTLTLLADVGAFPRPPSGGKIMSRQFKKHEVQISWKEAVYVPPGITTTKQYWVYTSMLVEGDKRPPAGSEIFLRPDKIMNTVCGLKNNTDRHYSRVDAAQCSYGHCNLSIHGIVNGKNYVFNIVAESYRGMMMSYAGLIISTGWVDIKQAYSDRTLQAVGAVSGSVLGITLLVFFILLRVFG